MFLRLVFLSAGLHGLLYLWWRVAAPAVPLSPPAVRGITAVFVGLTDDTAAAHADARSSDKRADEKNTANAQTGRSSDGGRSSDTASGGGAPRGVITRDVSSESLGIRYPEAAVRMGMQGTVVVRCEIPAGQPSCRNSVSLSRSSGYELLDRAALAGFQNFQGLKPAPEDRAYDFRIRFELVDPDEY